MASTATYFDTLSSSWSELYIKDSRFKRRHDLITELITSEVLPNLPKGSRVLDVGCGSGYFTHFLLSRGCTAIGVDLSREMIKQAEALNHKFVAVSQAKFKVLAAEDLSPAMGKFDLIICLSAIEYVKDDKQLLGMFSALLNPNGMLLVSVPNRSSLYRKIEGFFYSLKRITGNRLLKNKLDYLALQHHLYSEGEFDKLVSSLSLKKKNGIFLNAALSLPEVLLPFFEKKWWAAMYCGLYIKS